MEKFTVTYYYHTLEVESVKEYTNLFGGAFLDVIENYIEQNGLLQAVKVYIFGQSEEISRQYTSAINQSIAIDFKY